MLLLTWCGEQHTPEAACRIGPFALNRGVLHAIERNTLQKLAITYPMTSFMYLC